MRMILDLLISAGHPVDFIGDRHAEDPSYIQALRDVGIRVIIGHQEALAHLFINGGQYRAAWISRPEMAEQYLPLVRALAVKARVIYDTVDLHWIRFQRGIEYADDRDALQEQAERYRRIELSNAKASDLTIAITEEEKQTLLAEAPDLDVAVIPNVHRICDMVMPLAGRSGLFFIGGFHHAPNVDAVIWCVREILPLVHRRLPNLRFHIVGSDMPKSITSLKSKLVDPIGYVPDVTSWFEETRVFVAPLRHGAGMKGKIGQSLSFGLPVVTTSIGAEGIGLTHEVDALVADDPVAFADAIIKLCTDDELWTRISTNGYELVKQRYSSEAVARQLLPLLD
jgi:glycosyltransferase involved in cell wall biosynthesis